MLVIIFVIFATLLLQRVIKLSEQRNNGSAMMTLNSPDGSTLQRSAVSGITSFKCFQKDAEPITE